MGKERIELNKNNIKVGLRVRIGIPASRLITNPSENIPFMIWCKGKVCKMSSNKEGCIIKAKNLKYKIKNTEYIYFSTEDGIYHKVILCK